VAPRHGHGADELGVGLGPLVEVDVAGPHRHPCVVTTQDFIKFWGKIFIFILLVLIENSQGFKTFESI
jgi:hypothetical protein